MASGFRGLHPETRVEVIFNGPETQTVSPQIANWLTTEFRDCFSEGEEFEPRTRLPKSGGSGSTVDVVEAAGQAEADAEGGDLEGYEEEEGGEEDDKETETKA